MSPYLLSWHIFKNMFQNSELPARPGRPLTHAQPYASVHGAHPERSVLYRADTGEWILAHDDWLDADVRSALSIDALLDSLEQG